MWADSVRSWCPQCGFEDYEYTPPKSTSVLPEAFRTSLKHCFYAGSLDKYKGSVIVLIFNSAGRGKTSHMNPTVTANCPYCGAGQVMHSLRRISRNRRGVSAELTNGFQDEMRLECGRHHVIDVIMSKDWNTASWIEIYE